MSSESVVIPQENEEWHLESALDVLVVLLYAEGPKGRVGMPIEGITRLDKIMFMLSQSPEFSEIIDKGYQFKAYNYGPFAPELFDDIEALKLEGIIHTSKRAAYGLTELGAQIGSLLYKNLTSEQKQKLKTVKKTFGKMILHRLLHYVYSKYRDGERG